MLMKLRLLLALCLALALTGCSQGTSKSATDGRLQVVASLYPLAWLAEQVGGTRVDVTNLVPPGAEPHDIELTPRQVAAMSEADLVVYEPHVAAAVDAGVVAAKPRNALDVTKSVGMLTVAQEAAAGADKTDSADDTEDHGPYDPHFWLDPSKVASAAKEIASELSTIDPEHQQTYQSNLTKVTGELDSLDAEFKNGLATCQRKEFITTHAAFGYLAVRYHLTQIGVAGLSPDEEPSPSRIAEVQRLAKQYGVTTIFSEVLVSPALANTIAGDLKLKTDVLDPIEGITSESRGTDYPSVMRANLTALQKANGCS